MKYAVFAIFGAAMLALSGCNTVAGVSKDAWGGARYVGNAVFNDE